MLLIKYPYLYFLASLLNSIHLYVTHCMFNVTISVTENIYFNPYYALQIIKKLIYVTCNCILKTQSALQIYIAFRIYTYSAKF